MSALFESGFFVRKPAWHGMGVVLADYPGREEAMRLAGHDFDVVELPILTTLNPENPASAIAAVAGWKALGARRNGSTTVESTIGCVRESFKPVQNSTCWDIVDAIVGMPNVNYETGATLDGGALCFVTAWVDEPVQVPGDDSPVYPYIAANWRHDGMGAVKVIRTAVREVCANTVALAESEAARTGREYTFRHTKNVHDRIEDAKMALAGIGDVTTAFMAIADELAAIPISSKAREIFIAEFIPTPPEALISERVQRNIEEARTLVRRLIESSPTVPDAHRDTGYGLLMAGTEYLDHLRGYRNSSTYLGRTLLQREPLKDKLVPMIRDLAAA